MKCVKTPRTRSTVADRPQAPYPWNLIDEVKQNDGSWKITLNRTGEHQLPSGIFSKSIVDSHCVLTNDDDSKVDCRKDMLKTCKSVCLECVTKSKLSFNFVRSERFEFIPGEPVHKHSVSEDGSRKFTYIGRNATIGDPTVKCRSHAQIPPYVPSALDISNALRRLTPSVDRFFPTTNIYETLFELKELKGLLKLFTVNTRKSSPKNFRDGYLGYNFGYMPLISVIKDIITILLKLDGVIDQWNDFATANRIMDFHDVVHIREGEGEFTELNPDTSWHYAGTRSEYKYSWSQSSKIHLYIQPQIIPGNMRFRVLLKALGIDKPLAGVWELVPFSWLIDYFVNVDDMIARWETGLNSMFRFEAVALGYSMREEFVARGRKITIDKSPHKETVSNWDESRFTLYERTPLPASTLKDAIIPTEWGWADGPGGQQWTYVLAVAMR